MSIKKKVGGAILATVMGASLIGGGTFALFSAEADNAGNTFTAGTVTIADITGGEALHVTSFISNLAPGDAETAEITVENTGSLDAWVAIDSATTNADGIADNDIGDLFEGLNPVGISHDTAPVLIPAGHTATFTVGYDFPLDAGNEYQGDSGEVTFNIKAVQSRNNTNASGTGPISW